MRLVLRIVPLLAILATPLALATPAEAAGIVTVTPANGLVELQTIVVGGSGFDPSEQIYVCQGALPLVPGDTFCGNTLLQLVPVSPTGEFSTPYTVRRFMYMHTLGRTVDCADPLEDCSLFVHAFFPSGEILSTPISFAAPPPPPPTRGSITVTPDDSLQSQDVVTVSGTGFRPDTGVEVLECVPAPDDPTDCNFFEFTTATTDATGAFDVQHTVKSSVSLPSGSITNCRAAPGACVIAAAEVADFSGTVATASVSFAETALTTVTVTPNTDLVGGQLVAVAGSGFTPGAGLAWCQAIRSSTPSQNDCGGDLHLGTADAQGQFSGSYQVRASMFVASLGTTVDCTISPDACVIAAAEINDIAATVAYAELQFQPVVLPGVGRAVEGDSGTQDVAIPVHLSAPSTNTVTVDWTTAFVPTAPAGQADPSVDYTPASGTVTFAPGETTQFVTVPANGDTELENNEYFVVSFRNPTNAFMGGFWGLGFGVIESDDLPPTVLPSSATTVEGDTGSHEVMIPVSLSGPSTQEVTVDWTTFPVAGAPDFQAEPGDYTPSSGTVTFAPGETTQFVTVSINGDSSLEPDEYFLISFRNPTNTFLGGIYGLGFAVIQDDD